MSVEKTTAFVVSVDPGITGAIAVVRGSEFITSYEMPIQKKSSGRNEVDEIGLVNVSHEIRTMLEGIEPSPDIVVAIEQVSSGGPGHAGRRQGVASMFSMGDSFGCVRMFAAMLGSRLERVSPVSWKRGLGMNGKPKDFSITRARMLYPRAAPQLARKKDHGLAEALLIAHFVITYRS